MRSWWFILLALGGAAIAAGWGAGHWLSRSSPAAPVSAAIDADAIVAGVLGSELFELAHATGELAGNPTLAAGLAELDADAVRALLQSQCAASRGERCTVWDGDGDQLAKAVPEGMTENEGAAAAPPTGLALRVGKDSTIEITAAASVGASEDDLGSIRRTRQLGTAFKEHLQSITGSAWKVVGPDEWRALSRDESGWRLPVSFVAVGSDGAPQLPWWQMPAAVLALLGGLAIVTGLMARRLGRRFDAAAESAASAKAAQEAVAANVASHAAQMKDLEGRVARLSDLVAIEAGSFKVFNEKVQRLGRMVAVEVEALKSGDQPQPHLARIFRLVHTLKSNARLFRLNNMHHAIKVCEDDLAIWLRQTEFDAASQSALIDHVHYIEQEAAAYSQLRAKIFGDETGKVQQGQALELRLKWLVSVFGRTLPRLAPGELTAEVIDRLYGEYQGAAASVGREDVVEYLWRYDVMLADIAKRMGKQLEPIRFLGNCRFFDHGTMELLSDVFLHIMRNAVDHGIETSTRRNLAGKPSAGRITVESNVIGDFCALRISDDGRGIDPEELARKLVERGFDTEAAVAAMSEEQLLEAVFRTGFSTANAVTDISGRGVGMDVVRDIARQLGGDVRLTSTPGKGCELLLHFPHREARFVSRLLVFNLAAELELAMKTVGALSPGFEGRVTLVQGGRAPLVACDRLLFSQGWHAILVAALGAGARRVNIEVDHSGSADQCSLEAFSLRMRAYDAHGKPVHVATDIINSDRVSGWLLGSGLYYVPDADPALHTFELSAGVSQKLDGARIAVMLCIDDVPAVKEQFRYVVTKQFPGISVDLLTMADAERGLRDEHRQVTVVIDAKRLSDAAQIAALARLDRPNLVLLCDEIASLPLSAAFTLDDDPLIVAGSLDEAAVTGVLEGAIRRLLARPDGSAAGPLAFAA